MGLNVGESHAVNRLFDHMFGQPGPTGVVRAEDTIRAALMLLADGASSRLGAGWTGARVAAAWPEGRPMARQVVPDSDAPLLADNEIAYGEQSEALHRAEAMLKRIQDLVTAPRDQVSGGTAGDLVDAVRSVLAGVPAVNGRPVVDVSLPPGDGVR